MRGAATIATASLAAVVVLLAASLLHPTPIDSKSGLRTPGEEWPFKSTLPLLSRGQAPAAAYEPAFPGLPRYDRPVALIQVPNEDLMLLALADGRIMSFSREGPYSWPNTVHDQRGQTFCCGTEEAFLSLALDPEFGHNDHLYVYYSPLEDPRRTRLVRFTTTGSGVTLATGPESELEILEISQPFRNHNGGTILFGPDGMLYLSLGDGGAGGDPFGNGQDTRNNLLGSVIRIDVSGATDALPYRIPPDNPFLDVPGAFPEI